MVSDRYRLHRLRQGDEWALSTLAKGNARFGEGEDRPWVPPLSSDDASEFVNDPRTICVVAIHMETNHMAGFVYGGVLYRRHTKLRHICVYEIGIDIDHRNQGVGKILLEGIGRRSPTDGHRPGLRLRGIWRQGHPGDLRQRRRPAQRRHRDPLRLRVLIQRVIGPYAAGHV